MKTLKVLVSNPDKCDELFKRLDEIANDCDLYDYGLPIHNDPVMAQLREVLYKWAADFDEE